MRPSLDPAFTATAESQRMSGCGRPCAPVDRGSRSALGVYAGSSTYLKKHLSI